MLPEPLSSLLQFSIHRPALRAFSDNWIIGAALIAATCLLGWCYKGFIQEHSRDHLPSASPGSQLLPSTHAATFTLGNISAKAPRRRHPHDCPSLDVAPIKPPSPRAMRYHKQGRFAKKGIFVPPVPTPPPPKSKQPYEAFLVLDVEATCHQGTDFNFPNEIIEFPVCLMRWKDRTADNTASQLEVVEEFRSFVKPTWRPILSQFCTELTGITQKQVDSAPPFPAVLSSLQDFMITHGLIDGQTGDRLVRFCWCSDGPFDVRDFVVKQCFISRLPMPGWLQGDVLDVRTSVMDWLYAHEPSKHSPAARMWNVPRRRTLNIPAQLKALGLPGFEGRQHSGIDDSRNIAKIVAELARRGVSLHPNTAIHPNRRWQWMGKHGQVLEDRWLPQASL